jgi:hypothetical protein
MADYPLWFQQLRTYYASNSARMFVLHFNIDDYVIDPFDPNAITRLVPFLERYARRTRSTDGNPFSAIFRYSHSLDVVPDDTSEDTINQIAAGALGGAAIGGIAGATVGHGAMGVLGGAALGAAVARGRASDTFSHDIYRQEERGVGDLPEPSKVLRVFEHILRSPAQRSLVIIEHVEALAPSGYADQDQRLCAEILKRLATDYVFRSTDNLCLLISRDLNLIDQGIYAPGTNCFSIQIDLPNEAERGTFLGFMEAESQQEQLFSGGGPRRMRRSLISGLAQIDPQLREALERGQQATTRADQIRVLGKVAQGFRLVEIDQLNRQVRAEFEIAQQSERRDGMGNSVEAFGRATEHEGMGNSAEAFGGPALNAPAFGGSAPAAPAFSGGTSVGKRDTSATAGEAVIRLDDIKRHKRRAINEQSNGLLEVIDVQRGFDAIGGMEIVKDYLRALSLRILASSVDGRYHHLIPRGLILAGPPGTGKTIIAEALALESNLNMVKLRNVREGLVGQSERNLTRAFDVIKALSPILVFVDEIDQAFGNRGLGQSSDGGTSERIFGQILEFLGNDRNRGNVIWVTATNRPDVLDAALLRRFDRIIPCLLPTPEEQGLILTAMPKSITTLRYDPALVTLIERQAEEIIRLLEGKRGLVPTGAVIETIVRRAAECAGDRARGGYGDTTVALDDLRLAIEDYRSNADVIMYDYQSLLAIQACNFYSVMPLLPDRPPFDDLIEQRNAPLASVDGEGIVIPPFWREHAISYAKLNEQIGGHRAQLDRARRQEGG